MAHHLTRLIYLCVLSAVCCVPSAAVHAQVSKLLRYQGQAVDANGVPLEGPYTLTFRLYDAQTAGTTLWEEAQPNVPLSGGYFSVLLGQGTSLGSMNWTNPCWLSIQVNADPELAPRQQLTSVPTAIKAETAEQLEGPLVVTADKVGVGTPTPRMTVEAQGVNAGYWAWATVPVNPVQLLLYNSGGMYVGRDDSTGRSFFTTGSSPYAGILSSEYGPNKVPTDLHFGTYSRVRMTIDGTGNVGIGTSTPTNILTIQPGSYTDPIADSWAVYASDRQHKQILRTNPTGHLERIKALAVYEWTRTPHVSEEEARKALNDTESVSRKFTDKDYRPKASASQTELEQKTRELKRAKAQRPKFTAKRVGMAIDDPDVPQEVLALNDDGSTAGIDLLAYIGYLHAALKEAALKLEALEARLPDTQGK